MRCSKITTLFARNHHQILEYLSTSALKSYSHKMLNNLNFKNQNLDFLPVDVEQNNFPRQVRNALFCHVKPTPVLNPRLVCFSADALALLGLPNNSATYTKADVDEMCTYFSGNSIIPGSSCAAHAYCGYQFGKFSGQLGDGAAIYLGEIINTVNQKWELQLKGAGITPFSRGSDGRKVFRSSIREFLCSEAIHYLNIPTTRVGTLITSDTTVIRDPMYNGNTINEKCTIITRIAPNFFRFGSFELFKKSSKSEKGGPSEGDDILKKKFLDYILLYYSDIFDKKTITNYETDKYLLLFNEIILRTAKLVASWQSVGFVHGVLNTDNMSIMGLTLDYGPFGFMEYFDYEYVPNGSDSSGRYSYTNQPKMCEWNLMKLAEALSPLIPPEVGQRLVQERFTPAYEAEYWRLMYRKLGIDTPSEGDSNLVEDMFGMMAESAADFTDTFRALVHYHEQAAAGDGNARQQLVNRIVSRCASIEELILLHERKLEIHGKLQFNPETTARLQELLERDPQAVEAMLGSGIQPSDLQEVLTLEKRKMSLMELSSDHLCVLRCTSQEEKEDADRVAWSRWVDRYTSRLRQESGRSGQAARGRLAAMRQTSPAVVLRGWMAETATAAAEAGDDTAVWDLLELLKDPFAEATPTPAGLDGTDSFPPSAARFLCPPPNWAPRLIVTCSS